MRTLEAPALLATLLAVDERMRRTARIVIIGGAAAALQYDSSHATMDVDLFESPDPTFWRAYEEARAAFPGLAPVEHAPVADAPYEYASRLESLRLPEGVAFQHLRAFVPERHDLAIMKALRANSHDIDTLVEMHEKSAFSLEVLVERFLETGHAMGDPDRMRWNFLAVVEALFGDEDAAHVERELPSQG